MPDNQQMSCQILWEFDHNLGCCYTSNLLGQWAKYCNDERLHSALKYLRPVDYYKGNLEALLAEREGKMRKAVAKRKGVNRLFDLMKTKVGVYHFSKVDLSEND